MTAEERKAFNDKKEALHCESIRAYRVYMDDKTPENLRAASAAQADYFTHMGYQTERCR